ncbi:carbon-nitrogen hydrolase [Prolixibacteraceae bacterium]|nr:carbon-nitrogen hydrolase [Prolixibacteraceae bacterium]
MKRTVEVGIIQQRCVEDMFTNRAAIEQKVKEISREGAVLIVLQELHDTPYFCQTENTDLFDLAESIPGEASEFYSRVAKENQVVLVTSLFEKRSVGLYHNTAVVFEKDGEMLGKYRKMHIPDDPGFYEKFYFTPGDIGFEPIDTSVGRLGVLVCWDQWFPEAARLMTLAGAEMLIYPTAIGWSDMDDHDEQMRQKDAWVISQRAHAVANGIPVVSVNRVGKELDSSQVTTGIMFWGNSFVTGPQGEMLYEAPIDQEIVKVVKVDMSRSEKIRRWWPFLRDRRIESYDGLLKRFLK